MHTPLEHQRHRIAAGQLLHLYRAVHRDKKKQREFSREFDPSPLEQEELQEKQATCRWREQAKDKSLFCFDIRISLPHDVIRC